MKIENQKYNKSPILFPITFSEGNGIPTLINVLPVGSWNHPVYGPIIISPADITQFKQNFDAGLRKGIPITEGHESFDEKPAVGWFKSLVDKGSDGLWANVEWTEQGITLLTNKAYKYFSPEFYSEYEDPETRQIFPNVLVGGALTNKPYFKELQAIVLSEPKVNNQFIKTFNENNTMILEDILKKEAATLSDEEKQVVRDNKDKLSTEDLAKFGAVLDVVVEKTPEEVEKEKGDANEAAGLNRDGSAKVVELTQDQKDANIAAGLNEDGSAKVDAGAGTGEGEGEGEGAKVNATEPKVNASGKVEMSMSEYKLLTDKADKGFKAFDEMRKRDIKEETAKLIFSEQNSKGKILPKHNEKAFSFMLGLTATQRATFSEIVNEIPASLKFKELGTGGGQEGSAHAEIEAKVKIKMTETKSLRYGDAVKIVCRENTELAKRYELETSGK